MSELERIRRRYEAHHRDRRDAGEFVFVPERVPLLVAAVGGPGHRVLDLGCRSGAVAQHYLRGNEVIGLDVDYGALRRATERGIKPVHGNVEDPLPFDDRSFDVVVAGEMLEHVRAPAEVVAEIRRVLRPGGTFAGSVPNAFRVQSRLLFLAGQPPEDDPTHLHMYSPRALVALLAGFARPEISFVGGRFRGLHPRLLSRDMVFVARLVA